MNARKQKSQAGTVLVEAAFTLMLLFMFLLGIIEAGRFMNVQEVLTNAAREGARMSVAPITQTTCSYYNGCVSPSDIQTTVQTFLSAANITNATVTPSTWQDPACTSGCVTYTRVQVTATYSLITMSMFGSLEVPLKGEALMRNETSPY